MTGGHSPESCPVSQHSIFEQRWILLPLTSWNSWLHFQWKHHTWYCLGLKGWCKINQMWHVLAALLQKPDMNLSKFEHWNSCLIGFRLWITPSFTLILRGWQHNFEFLKHKCQNPKAILAETTLLSYLAPHPNTALWICGWASMNMDSVCWQPLSHDPRQPGSQTTWWVYADGVGLPPLWSLEGSG